MLKSISLQVKGAAPLLMRNGQTSDPLNHFSKAIKDISGKRAKTDADFIALSEIEYRSGLYIDKNGPYLPSIGPA